MLIENEADMGVCERGHVSVAVLSSSQHMGPITTCNLQSFCMYGRRRRAGLNIISAVHSAARRLCRAARPWRAQRQQRVVVDTASVFVLVSIV